jgi:hypothetical protein
MEVAGLEPVVSVLTEGAVALEEVKDMEAVLVACKEEVVEVVMEEGEMSDLEAQIVRPLREVADLGMVIVALTEQAVV